LVAEDGSATLWKKSNFLFFSISAATLWKKSNFLKKSTSPSHLGL
jgi:hypothetical protein